MVLCQTLLPWEARLMGQAAVADLTLPAQVKAAALLPSRALLQRTNCAALHDCAILYSACWVVTVICVGTAR
jgi:hypothetical protein